MFKLPSHTDSLNNQYKGNSTQTIHLDFPYSESNITIEVLFILKGYYMYYTVPLNSFK